MLSHSSDDSTCFLIGWYSSGGEQLLAGKAAVGQGAETLCVGVYILTLMAKKGRGGT